MIRHYFGGKKVIMSSRDSSPFSLDGDLDVDEIDDELNDTLKSLTKKDCRLSVHKNNSSNDLGKARRKEETPRYQKKYQGLDSTPKSRHIPKKSRSRPTEGDSDSEETATVMNALKDVTNVLKSLVKRVENAETELKEVKDRLVTSPSSSSDSGYSRRKFEVPLVVRVS